MISRLLCVKRMRCSFYWKCICFNFKQVSLDIRAIGRLTHLTHCTRTIAMLDIIVYNYKRRLWLCYFALIFQGWLPCVLHSCILIFLNANESWYQCKRHQNNVENENTFLSLIVNHRYKKNEIDNGEHRFNLFRLCFTHILMPHSILILYFRLLAFTSQIVSYFFYIVL